MRDLTIYTTAVLGLLFLATCSGLQKDSDMESDPFLDEYFAAFNNHEIESLLDLTDDDIRMMSITPDTVIIDLAGKQALKSWLEGYFSSLPNVSSTYDKITMREPFVSFVETASWGPDSARKHQASLATYLIKDHKIQRVWYYYPE